MSTVTQYATKAIHAGVNPDPTTGSILTPIYQTTTYVQEAVGKDKGYTYTRSGNPTVTALEDKLASLEGVEKAVSFSTGMAAITALFLATLKAGDHVICSAVVYGGTVRLLRQVLEKFSIQATFVDTSNLELVKESIRPNSKLFFIETPANPTLLLTDIEAIADIAHDVGALCVVDNTFLTPVLQQVFKFGVDVSLYSTTKFIDGHNATVGGALITRDEALTEQFQFVQNAVGFPQSPFEAWLTLQGIKTLPIRLRQHSENALEVAEFLKKHPQIESVFYPGLESFPQYELAQKQQQAGGGMLAFEVKGGVDAGITLMNSVKLISLAENLGAVESLITHPASMTHSPIPKEEREAIGITDSLVRLSVGLESVGDIIEDLDYALYCCRRNK